MRIAQAIVAIGQEQMSRVVGIVARDGPRSLGQPDVVESSIGVEGSEVGPAYRSISMPVSERSVSKNITSGRDPWREVTVIVCPMGRQARAGER